MQVRLTTGVLDLERGQLEGAGGVSTLSATERRVLAYLVEQDRAVGQDELLERVWGYAASVRSRTVRVTVGRIRAKIERDPAAPEHLLTEPGLGYRFAPLPPTTVLIGRERDRRALARAGRVVTLVGPGGVGKTSLARDLAERVGALWVGCGDAHTAEALVDRVSQALGQGLARDPVEAIRRAQPSYMVLDNLEQVDDPSPIARWTEGRVVVTSRRALGLPEEEVLALAPLSGEAARELLALRWTQAGGEPLSDDDCAAISEALDGLPLALELVSSWAELLVAEDVRRRLGDSVGWVADQRRPDRHRSLHAVVSSSWELLAQAEQRALAELTAFRGSISPGDAEAVLAPGTDVLGALKRLRGLSLLTGRGRFQLPRPVWEFAAPHCPPEAWERHAALFLERAEALPGRGRSFRRTLSVLSRDRDELFAAHARAEDPVLRRRIVQALDPLLELVGPHRPMLAMWEEHGGPGLARGLRLAGRLQDALAEADRCGSDLQANRALLVLGRPAEGEARARAALAKVTAAADRARCTTDLGRQLWFQGQLDRAEARFREALALGEQSGDTLAQARALCFLGELRTLRADRESLALLERALSLDPTPALRLMIRGRHATALDRFDDSGAVIERLQEDAAEARRLGLLGVEVNAMSSLGNGLLHHGRAEEAEVALRAGIGLCRPGHQALPFLRASLALCLAEQGRRQESEVLAELVLAAQAPPFFAAWAQLRLALAAGWGGADPLPLLRQATDGQALDAAPWAARLGDGLLAFFDPAAPCPEVLGDPEADCVIALARARRGAPGPTRVWPGSAVRLLSRELGLVPH